MTDVQQNNDMATRGVLGVTFLEGAFVVHGQFGVARKEVGKGGERINGVVACGGSIGAADLNQFFKGVVGGGATIQEIGVCSLGRIRQLERHQCLDDGRCEHGDALDGTPGRSTIHYETDSCARYNWLVDRVGSVVHEATGETAIVRDGLGEVGHGEAAFVEAEGGGGSSCW